jgi:hypothetical protein
MASFRKAIRIARCACAALGLSALAAASAALASQGPGTASSVVQLAMAVLWRCRARGLRRTDRRREAALKDLDLSTIFLKTGALAAPIADHVRHDDRAAWPIFLHVGGVAYAHGVGAGIIAGDDALLIGCDAKPGRRAPARRERILRRGLGDTDTRCRLRARHPRGRHNRSRKRRQDCHHADSIHHAHPKFSALISNTRVRPHPAPSQNGDASACNPR